ncbi:hypothetical protein GOODEAATRI_009397 [Goodea atripinnis]|uniref:Secreted protein n=1 Tax=Goodea atripinnis TaxID=208336 RepID=A0ABV0P317_9TELE
MTTPKNTFCFACATLCLSSLSIWKTHLCPVKCNSPSCSKTTLKHDATTPVLHSRDGVLRPASPLSLPKYIDSHHGQTLQIQLIRKQYIYAKIKKVVPLFSCKW